MVSGTAPNPILVNSIDHPAVENSLPALPFTLTNISTRPLTAEVPDGSAGIKDHVIRTFYKKRR
jgi:hypothetical protein